MNKTTMWALIIAAFIVGGVAGFLVERQRATDKMEAYKMEVQTQMDKAKAMVDVTPTESMANSDLVRMASGGIVTASNNMTLYTYDKDTVGKSNCSGQCAVNWPPYTVSGAVAQSLPAHLGTVKRADESTQYTWDGKPLYFYIGDKKEGDVTGDGVGGVWHVVK